MKSKFIFILMILANVLQAQTVKYSNEAYYWVDKDTVHSAKIAFNENGQFELIEDSFYDCTPMFLVYGIGEYQIIKDSVLLVFDSISTLESTCNIDSLSNDDEYSNLKITVLDQNGKKMSNAALHWGKPKRKRRRTTAQFFEEPFDEEVELIFTNNEKVNFVRIEKEGYYSGTIPIPKHPNKDYKIEVVLRPKPKVESRYYISNLKVKVVVVSDCEIQYYDGRVLRKVSCD